MSGNDKGKYWLIALIWLVYLIIGLTGFLVKYTDIGNLLVIGGIGAIIGTGMILGKID